MLSAAQADAPWAYESRYRSLSPAVGYLRLRGAVDAEDLTSEVFLGAFSGDEDQFRSWVGSLGTLPGGGGGNIPRLHSVTGCAPMDVSKCVTSITSAISTRTGRSPGPTSRRACRPPCR
ncbi:MAG TPA: hypothetical protein VHF27_06215 [Acidimicrobiales bacterium]|nr:hypothetical protein [Acidimicrobiales bacterium]